MAGSWKTRERMTPQLHVDAELLGWFEPRSLRALTPEQRHPTTPRGFSAMLTREYLKSLSPAESRMLTGGQLDSIIAAGLEPALGTKWIQPSQECWYRPDRPSHALAAHVNSSEADAVAARARPGPSLGERLRDKLGRKAKVSARRSGRRRARRQSTAAYAPPSAPTPSDSDESRDIAILMVDNRTPMPYQIPGTTLRSPDSWGTPRRELHEVPVASTFQMALVINHMYTQLHGYRFYLENPCPQELHGVDERTWKMSLDPFTAANQAFTHWTRWKLSKASYCPSLPASHKFGPFPPRATAWVKLAALRYVMRRHSFVAYLDSDCYFTEVWQPLWPLLNATGLTSGRWVAAAEEFPPQKLKGVQVAGLANSGVLLLAGAPIAGAGVLKMMEEWIWPYAGRCVPKKPRWAFGNMTDAEWQRKLAAMSGCNPIWLFDWPYEQNALTNSIFARYPDRYTLLQPGCPINSPFGAFIRHFVGGTPAVRVYAPQLRQSWMSLALHCTLETVRNAASEADVAPAACTPNEPVLSLPVAGCDEFQTLADSRPVRPDVYSRLNTADSRMCCAFCNAAPQCAAWAHEADRPLGTINCWLMTGFASVRASEGHVIGRRQAVHPQESQQQVTYAVSPLRLSTWRDFEWSEAADAPLSRDQKLKSWMGAHFNRGFFDST